MRVLFTSLIVALLVGLLATPAYPAPGPIDPPGAALAYNGAVVVGPAMITANFTYTTNAGWSPNSIMLVARHPSGLLYYGTTTNLVAGRGTVALPNLPAGTYTCWALLTASHATKPDQLIAPSPNAFVGNLVVMGAPAPALGGSVTWTNVNPNPSGGVEQISGTLDSGWNQPWNLVQTPKGMGLTAIPLGGGRVFLGEALPVANPNNNNAITITGVLPRNDYYVIGGITIERRMAGQVVEKQIITTTFKGPITVTASGP